MAHYYAFMMKVSKASAPETCVKVAGQDPQWMDAMKEEMQALVENNAWE